MTINVGDKIRVIRTEDDEGEYEVGDILTISNIEPDGFYWVEEFESPYLFEHEFEKVEAKQ